MEDDGVCDATEQVSSKETGELAWPVRELAALQSQVLVPSSQAAINHLL